MILDDLERLKRHSCRNETFMEPPENLNEDRSTTLAAKYRPMILVSKNIKCMRIFMWVPERSAVKRQFGREYRPTIYFNLLANLRTMTVTSAVSAFRVLD